MGWQNCHLHMFAVGPDSYGEPHPDDWKPLLDERKATLQKVASEPGNSIDYEYDFGDPSDPEHDQYVNWIGGRWDAEEFNLDTVNTLLLPVKSPRTTR